MDHKIYSNHLSCDNTGNNIQKLSQLNPLPNDTQKIKTMNYQKNKPDARVVDIFSNTLTDFSQSKSDATNIEASDFEKLERDYKIYLKEEKGEEFIVSLVEEMCASSLTPDLYSFWLILKNELATNRSGLPEDNQYKRDAEKARDWLISETLQFLKILMQDSGNTPDHNDASRCCHLD